MEYRTTTVTVMELQIRWKNANIRDRLLGGQYLNLDENSMDWILNHIDYFVSESQGNQKVKHVSLLPYAFKNRDYDVWDKVGQAIGNLQALDQFRIRIFTHNDDDEGDSSDEDDDAGAAPVPILDWEILARILRHVRQKVTLLIDESPFAIEEVQPFARAICGHPTITRFEDKGMFPYESLGSLFSTLTTLPALESIMFSAPEGRQADESTLAHPESLTELLRVPTLRVVRFKNFSFTPALFQAMANALMEGTAVTNFKFIHCSFSAVEWDLMMANGLSRNTSVISIIARQCDNTRALFDVLAAALPSNSTLRYLELELGEQEDDDPDCLSPVFSALGQNTGLKSLNVYGFGLMDESLSTAMKDGLGMNETLESLELKERLCDENSTMWCRALSFLRTNRSLKSLMVTFDEDATKSSCFDALCRHIAAMLQDNASLESLTVGNRWSTIKVKAEEYLFFITALQHNTTLKSLNLQGCGSLHVMTTLTHDEDKQMAVLLKKNYALESLPNINLKNRAREVRAILRLNEAGRRYLIQDGSSISKGVQVLSAVSSDINCVFLHLLENPRLCDRCAVETASDRNEHGGPTSPVNHIEKREHGKTQNEGKESRRRLA